MLSLSHAENGVEFLFFRKIQLLWTEKIFSLLHLVSWSKEPPLPSLSVTVYVDLVSKIK